MPPLILISSTSGEDRNRPYLETLAVHGGRAQLIHPGGDFRSLRPAGILLPGGGDLSEHYYDHAVTDEERRTLGRIEPERERFETDMMQWAAEQNVPVLGICRGCQMMNAFAGGTLIPDIPLWRQTHGVTPELPHRQQGDDSLPAHPIRLEAGSRLAGILGNPAELQVNSSHHQALGQCGGGLRVAARGSCVPHSATPQSPRRWLEPGRRSRCAWSEGSSPPPRIKARKPRAPFRGASGKRGNIGSTERVSG